MYELSRCVASHKLCSSWLSFAIVPFVIIIACTFTFLRQILDPNNLTNEGRSATLFWAFEIVPAPAAQFVRPRLPTKESPLDDIFPPADIMDAECCCNCVNSTGNCLVSMIANTTTEDSQDVAAIAGEDADTESPCESPVSSEEECSAGEDCEEDEEDEIEYFTETFEVKGSYWEGRYQESLVKCMELKAKGENVEVRTCFEPDNLRDRNAIKFEVLYFAAWHIIGYCGVEKIPKLNKAIRLNEIISCKLNYIKRQWIHPVSAFRHYAAVSITKKGRWEKNDPNNKYNSVLTI